MADGYVGLEEAAQRAERSPRTIQRWVRSGLVTAERDRNDQRRLLVNLAEVKAAASRQPVTELEADELVRAEERRREADRMVCDLALLRAQSYQLTLGIELNGPSTERPLDELRTTPLGRKLDYICAVARGDLQDPPDRVAKVVDSVLQTLFWTPGVRKPRIPIHFWRGSLLGREIARARVLTYPPGRLVQLRDAAKELDTTPERIKDLLETLQLDYFYDPDLEAPSWVIPWVIPPDSMTALQKEWNRGDEEEDDDALEEEIKKQEEEDQRDPSAKAARWRNSEDHSLRNDDGRYEPETGGWAWWHPETGLTLYLGGHRRQALVRRNREVRERYYAIHYGIPAVTGNHTKEGTMPATS